MLQKLFECEKSYQTEMSLSPYMYYILRTASSDSIILILTRSYENNAKGRNIDLLMEMGNSFFSQTEEDGSKEMDGSSISSTVIELPRPVSIPRSWAKLDEEFAEYCKGLSLNFSRFIPLHDSFNITLDSLKKTPCTRNMITNSGTWSFCLKYRKVSNLKLQYTTRISRHHAASFCISSCKTISISAESINC